MNEEYIKFIIKEYKIDYIVHGDDPCIVDGKDVYEAAQKMGKKEKKTLNGIAFQVLFGCLFARLLVSAKKRCFCVYVCILSRQVSDHSSNGRHFDD